MQKLEEKVMSEHLLEATRLVKLIDHFNQRGKFDMAYECHKKLERLYAYKREQEQLELLKQNLIARGYSEIVIKIEEVHLHG